MTDIKRSKFKVPGARITNNTPEPPTPKNVPDYQKPELKPKVSQMKWIKDRLKESSTYQGTVALLAAIGVSVSPDLVEAIGATAVSIIGLIQVIKKDKAE